MLYKLGDALLGVMVPPLWKDLGFSASQFGMAAIVAGKIPYDCGSHFGRGAHQPMGDQPGPVALGDFSGFFHLGFGIAALPGMGHYELVTLPLPFLAFNLKVFPIHLATLGESLTGGMGSAPFMAFMMLLCDKRHSATHYAFFSMLFGFTRSIAGYLGGWGRLDSAMVLFSFILF